MQFFFVSQSILLHMKVFITQPMLLRNAELRERCHTTDCHGNIPACVVKGRRLTIRRIAKG